MKKTVLILLCLLLVGAVVFAALYFAKRGETPAVTETAATVEVTETAAPETTEVPFTVQPVEVTLPISAADVHVENIDTEDEALDAALAAMAQEIFRAYIPNAASLAAAGADIRYDAKMRGAYRYGRIYSAVFGGSYAVYDENGAGADEGEIFYTVNIDTEKMKLLALTDWVDVSAMYRAFEDGRFVPAGSKAIADVSLSQYPPEYGIYPHVYLADGCFCLNIEQSGAYTENVQYKLPLAEADFILPAFLAAE